jgi:hypothetical protein
MQMVVARSFFISGERRGPLGSNSPSKTQGAFWDDLRVQVLIANGTLRQRRRLSEENARLNTDEATRKQTDFDLFEP